MIYVILDITAFALYCGLLASISEQRPITPAKHRDRWALCSHRQWHMPQPACPTCGFRACDEYDRQHERN